MLGWSSKRTDYYIHEQPAPIKRKGSKMVCIKFIVDENENLVPSNNTANPFVGIVSKEDESEKAVITGVYLKFVQNDFSFDDIEIYLETVFKPEDHLKYDENSIEHGTITIPCPPKMHKAVPESDELMYRPVVVLDTLFHYAGLEDKIFKPYMRIHDMAADEKAEEDEEDNGLYPEDHPIMKFIAKYRKDFKISKSNFEKQTIDGTNYYKVEKSVLDKIRLYFQTKIFKNIHYTRFENTRVTTNQKGIKRGQNGIVIILQINYIVVNKNSPV